MPVPAEFEALEAEVSRNTTVDGSAKALLTGLKTMLDDALAGNDVQLRAKVTEITAKLRTDNDDLAAAVSAHTPAGPVVEPTPQRRK